MKTHIQKIGLVTVVAVLITVFSFNVYAADGGGGGGSSSDILVIKSQDLSRDLGLRLVHKGSIYYSSPSIDWEYPGTSTGTNVVGKYAEDVFKQLAAFQYNIRLKNPNDVITVYAYGSDDNGNTLFYGSAEFKVGEKPKIQMWQQWVPILSNVKSAEVIPLREDGTSGEPITMNVSEQGQLLWQPWLSGAPNGLLAVKYNDGRLVTYRLSQPVGHSPIPSGGMSSLTVQGHSIFLGQNLPNIDVVAVWNKPTVYFETTGGYINFDVRGIVQLPDGSTFLERPSAMELTDDSGNNAFQYKLSTTGSLKVLLPGGRYRVRSFEWGLFAQPNTLYAGPSDGGSVPITAVIEEK